MDLNNLHSMCMCVFLFLCRFHFVWLLLFSTWLRSISIIIWWKINRVTHIANRFALRSFFYVTVRIHAFVGLCEKNGITSTKIVMLHHPFRIVTVFAIVIVVVWFPLCNIRFSVAMWPSIKIVMAWFDLHNFDGVREFNDMMCAWYKRPLHNR